MTPEELKEFEKLKEKVEVLAQDIDKFNKRRKYLVRKKKKILKEIEELEAKYESSDNN